jgi:hypothetical protein
MSKKIEIEIKKGNTERWTLPISTGGLSPYVEEGNELIASFEGFKTYVMNGYTNVEYSDDNVRTIQDTHYHSSWDWLMPIIEKIEDFRDENSCSIYNFTIEQCFVEVIENRTSDTVLECDGMNKLDASYDAVVEFIKWYNENN